MDKLNLTKITQASKKVLIRKEIEEDRLGEEVYSDDLLSPYSVYLVRKFEQGIDYEKPEQFEELLKNIIEEFEQEFQNFVIKNIYVRSTQKAVYITFLLALAQPLGKAEINALRKWMSHLKVPEILEKLPSITQEVPFEMVKGLQETTSEVLLLTEMMNQFNSNLSDIYDELQSIKNKKTPPVVKVVKSDVARKKSIESENAELLKQTIAKVEGLFSDFSNFKAKVDKELTSVRKTKKPPKFKIVFGGEGTKPSLEDQLKMALKKIDGLTNDVKYSERKITELSLALEKNQNKVSPKIQIPEKKEKKNSELEEKLAITTEEVTALTKQLQEISKKLTTVETDVLEVKPTPETVARIEKDRGQLQETTTETMKLNQVIDGLNKKLENVETELITVKKTKKAPVIKLKKSETMNNLAKRHQADQEQLMMNATQIKKLTQTIGKVDVELIKAHQKIAELEQAVHFSRNHLDRSVSKQPIRQSDVPPVQMQQQPIGPKAPERMQTTTKQAPLIETRRNVNQEQTMPVKKNTTHDFPSKEDFLRASRPLSTQVRMQAEVQAQVQNQARAQQTGRKQPTTSSVQEDRVPVTLAIEEMLDRVSYQPVNDEKYSTNPNTGNNLAKEETPSLRRLKKMEWEIHSLFQKTKGLGHKGMVSKRDFYANLRKIEVLPYLWTKIYEIERKDILLGNDLSCQDLMDELEEFIEEVKGLSQKRKVMGKWIYCPKEVEQKMEGYKALGEYFELYAARKEGAGPQQWEY